MEKSKGMVKIVASIFVFVEVALGVLIQTTGGVICRILCFSSIVLSFLFSLFLSLKNREADTAITAVALLFTVISDFFLVVMSPAIRVPAMFSFSFAQICYFLRIYRDTESRRERSVHLWVRFCAAIVFLVACPIVLREKTDLLSMVSVFYFANLLANLVFAFMHYKRSLLFPLGLLFFIMCDLFVGLSVMSELYFEFSESSLIYRITHTELDLIWLFYVPSQTLIPLSLIIKQGEE